MLSISLKHIFLLKENKQQNNRAPLEGTHTIEEFFLLTLQYAYTNKRKQKFCLLSSFRFLTVLEICLVLQIWAY